MTKAGTAFWNLKLEGWERKRHTFKTYAEAEAHELQAILDHKLGKPYRPPVDSDSKAGRVETIGDLVEHCYKLQWKEQRSDKYTHKKAHMHPQYRNALLFRDWVGPKVPAGEALTSLRIDQYVVHRRDELGNSGSTLKKHLSALQTLLGKGVAMGLCPVFFKFQKIAKAQGKKRRAYEQREVAEILAVTKRLGRDEMHDLFVVLVETGIRPPMEISRVPWRDIRPTRITVDASISKTGHERKVPVSPVAREAIERMSLVHGAANGPFHWANQDVITDFWEILRKHIKWLDKKTVPYSFRHTCASRWANDRRINPHDACKWLGHSMTVHEGYVHPIDEADDFEALVRELHPQQTGTQTRIEQLKAELASLQGTA